MQPTGVERFFDENDLIVSKTDLKGRITYTNHVFRAIAGYTGAELDGAPHSLIRHPDMPRCVFKLLWDTIAVGGEVFAYVKNMTKNGDHYWVFAHVTPSYDANGTMVGYHSNRRVPNRRIVDEVIVPIYRQLLDAENKTADRKAGMMAGHALLTGVLKDKGVSYDEFIHTL
ncbi:Chemotaxis sensory transducer [Polymorphum gilvum SL003B-26A1]|uniref:Chemotaxis sensory transducer n=1 Tax=Polymorphum gilvum (strain LMG 25793 / CGMCC 1.9160 / SL003B-26A1) TaxID=991905 RepID=F2J3K9_POLGS|nr:Chemotaxis sensory transducer [Polymorphum gilvum SL003B-26A1]